MSVSIEYSIELPRLYQLRGSTRIVITNNEQNIADDALGNFYPIDQCEPIPLTFWWLRVFGFTCLDNTALEEYFLDNESYSRFSVYRNDEGRWFCITNSGRTELAFVHQLQEIFDSFRQPA